MNRTANAGLTLLFILLFGAAYGQLPEYAMSDTTVTDCDGFLFDSGGSDDSYANNENLVFTVNTGGASILLTFIEEICIEDNFDFLYIHDGEDLGSPLIATITGAGFIPPSITATSGAVTFHFVSDASANYCGFAILWDTIVEPPVPPALSANPPEVCGSTQFTIDFSTPINCEWLVADSVVVTGLSEFQTVLATVDCINGTGSSATLTLAEELDYNCTYEVSIQMGIPDVCDSIWVYTLNTTFDLELCPINGFVTASDTLVCAGGCVTLEAFAEGCDSYEFAWNEGIPDGPGPHEVCPEVSTVYEVTITELSTGNTAVISTLIDLIDASIAWPDTVFCRTEPAQVIPLNSEVSGTWFGQGIIDQESGLFLPDSAAIGPNTIYFVASELCVDSIVIDVLPIDAGLVTAACPGSPEFALEAEPPGGTWAGDFVTEDGIFDPAEAGSFTLTYFLGTCQDTLLINVDELDITFAIDTLCQSEWPDTLQFEPFGGFWSGAGIVDSLLGVFAPGAAPPGNQSITYQVEGCSQTFEFFVKEINTGRRVRSSCPEQDPYIPFPNFTPIGGFWEGNGIVDAQTGLYDPGSLADDTWTALVYFAPNGCTDTIFIYNKQTEILSPPLYFCDTDPPFLLDQDNTGRTPFGGIWIGNGILQLPEDEEVFFFDPATAGIGAHVLTYSANTCDDSFTVYVFPETLEEAPQVYCTTDDPVVLSSFDFPGATWSGPGIVDETNGLFDPAQAGFGAHTIVWDTPAGCSGTIEILVEQFIQAEILGLSESYCFEDIDVELSGVPAGGLLSGTTGPNSFNPAIAGEGSHVITYEWSGESCSSSVEIEVFVFPELIMNLTASETTICLGEGSVLTGTVEGGGSESLYTYTWSDGAFPINTNSVSPSESQWFSLTVDDGCSPPVTDSVFIDVRLPVQVSVTTSDTLCFGLSGGFATATVLSEGDFSIDWQGPGIADGATLFTTAGTQLTLIVVDEEFGCSFDSLVVVPSYTTVNALFGTNPNADCISWDDQPIELLDFSENGLYGTWDFGNGTTQNYLPGEQVTVSYAQAGQYTITLTIYNEGDCESIYGLGTCLLPETPIFVPDIFSPNGDGNNDVLFVRGFGIVSMSFLVYNRWGERVFESNHPEQGWDGRYRGAEAPSGGYTYVLRAELGSGEVQELSGKVILVR